MNAFTLINKLTQQLVEKAEQLVYYKEAYSNIQAQRNNLQAQRNDLQNESNRLRQQLANNRQATISSTVLNLLLQQQRIEAIKEHRAETGMGLKDTKDMLDEYFYQFLLPYISKAAFADANGYPTKHSP